MCAPVIKITKEHFYTKISFISIFNLQRNHWERSLQLYTSYWRLIQLGLYGDRSIEKHLTLVKNGCRSTLLTNKGFSFLLNSDNSQNAEPSVERAVWLPPVWGTGRLRGHHGLGQRRWQEGWLYGKVQWPLFQFYFNTAIFLYMF